MSSMIEPVSGPCSAWVTAQEVADCCSVDVGTNVALFEDVALAASQLLFELSGRQFTGSCEQTVRPCADGCACWDYVVSPAVVPQVPWGFSWGYWGCGWGWGWEGCNQTDGYGCGAVSQVLLQGYPVTEITQVKINGDVLAASEYRLDGYRWLVRMADTDGNAQTWPSCQRLDLPDTEECTWSVTYTFGVEPPVLGVRAAAEVACELYKACSGAECQLPLDTSKLTRQGVTIERAPFVRWAWSRENGWATGLLQTDAFLAAYNPGGSNRRAIAWSPDIPQYGRVIPESS